jgi:hypothetical protein
MDLSDPLLVRDMLCIGGALAVCAFIVVAAYEIWWRYK